MSRNRLLLVVFLYVLLSSVSYASFDIKHCTADCGNVLVGAAFFQPNSITWVSNGSSGTIELKTGGVFGFSGDSIYRSQLPSSKWLHRSTHLVSVNAMSSSVFSMGHYFAPDKAGELENTNSYQALLDSAGTDQKVVTVQGRGIADDKNNPAITLDVGLKRGAEELCQDGTAPCEVTVPDKSNLTFTVTPNVANVPVGVQPVKHVFIDLIFHDTNTQCESKQQSFNTQNRTPNNFNDINQYYHYMGSGGPWETNAACDFYVPFLVSVGKPFQIQAQNLRSTEGGYANITFAVRGHYDRDNPKTWGKSQHTFHLRTPTTGKLNVTVNGEGSVSSLPGGINCPTTCTAEFQAGTNVTLTATSDIGVVIWNGDCSENGVVNIGIGTVRNCTVTFPSLLGDHALTLDPNLSSLTKFYGTISVDGKSKALNFGNPINIQRTQKLEINTIAIVDSNDVGKQAEVLVVMQVGNSYYMKIATPKEEIKFIKWTGTEFLAAAGYQDSLEAHLEIKAFGKNFFQEMPNIGGVVNVWIGYRLIDTGNIVFNEIAIPFNIQ